MEKIARSLDEEQQEETFEQMLRRNHGRLVVLRPETPGAELAQMNVVHTPEELRKIGDGVVATLRAMRAIRNWEQYVDRLQALENATPLFDFEK